MNSTERPVLRRIQSPLLALRREVTAFAAVTVRVCLTNYRAYKASTTIGQLVEGIAVVGMSVLLYQRVFAGQVTESFKRLTGGDYLGFVMFGVLFYAFSESALLTVSRAFASERRENTFELFVATPAGRHGYFLGYLVGQLVSSAPSILALYLASLAMGIHLRFAGLGDLFFILAIASVGLVGFGVVVGLVATAVRDLYSVQNTMVYVVYFLSGVLFPVEYLPVPLRLLSLGLPTAHGLRALRYLEAGGQGHPYVALAVVSVFWYVAAILLYRRLEVQSPEVLL